MISNGREVFSLCFFSQVSCTPEIHVIIRFLEVLAPHSEDFRVWRYHNTVQPGRKKKHERETDVSCEKRLKDPECVRFEYVAEDAEGESETSCDAGVSSLM